VALRILLTADPELPVPPRLYGGIERIVDWLARGLVGRGLEVGLVAHPESRIDGVRLFPWTGRRSRSLRDTFRNMGVLDSAVRQHRPDVVHSFSRVAYLLPLLARRLPKIMSYQRMPSPRPVRWAAQLAGRSLVYTGCSEYISQMGRSHGGEWRTIHNGVEESIYTYRQTVPEGAPLLFLSRLDRVKAPHLAISIAKAANVPLILAGNIAESGPDREYFERVVAPKIDGVAVQYVGPVGDAQKDALLGQARALLVPIQWDEPFGIVFAEALACGTPVISSPRGALPEIIRDGREGFLVKTVEEGIQAVARLDAISRAACRERFESRFRADQLVDLYINLYNEQAAAR
jgi:glycosyltransferase involved in cell wall biosynthesis